MSQTQEKNEPPLTSSIILVPKRKRQIHEPPLPSLTSIAVYFKKRNPTWLNTKKMWPPANRFIG